MHTSTIALLLLQVTLILFLSRVMGVLAARFRQPKVVGEMLAGIMLGPSLFGWIAPDLAAAVFPPDSINLLNVLAQIGVIFFLFLIGLELDPRLIRERGHAAVVISHVSIIAPFLLGAALTLYLYPRVFNDTPQMRFSAAALFMGAAMSITAFPVLARILIERDLQQTTVGALAITCAAVDDVTAWCMLAFVIAIGRAEGLLPGAITFALSLTYVAVMLLCVRPLLGRLVVLYERHGISAQIGLAVVLGLTLLSAATTEWIGIHALFGAFLMGAILPKNQRFARLMTERMEDFTVVFLLPIFFAYAGLRTQIGLLDSPYLWSLTGLIVLVACLGKFGGSALAARASGLGLRESAAIGILMNTRGLVELVILTIGLQLGVITDAVFAMMVIMALVTTAMTTPILDLVYPRSRYERSLAVTDRPAREYSVVIPVSRPESASGLAQIAHLLTHGEGPARIYGLDLHRPSINEDLGTSLSSEAPAAGEGLQALAGEAAARELAIDPIVLISRDVASDIARVARAKQADLILMGHHKPVLGQAILGGTVHRVLTGSDTDVAILVDRGIPRRLDILIPYQGTPHDRLAVSLVHRMASAPDVKITILHVARPAGAAGDRPAGPSIRKQTFPDSVAIWVVEDASPVDAVLEHAGRFNLIVVGLSEEWGLESQLLGLRAERIARDWPDSLLLVRKHALPAALEDTGTRTIALQSTSQTGGGRT